MPISSAAAARVHKVCRPFIRKGGWHWVRFAGLLLLGWYVGHQLSDNHSLTDLRYSIYHRQLAMRSRAALYPQRTALVLLDDGDYWGDRFQSRTPLRRDVLADLLDKLNAAGVKTVALDVDLRSPRPKTPDFEYPIYQPEDDKLIAAIQRMCAASRTVVLASSITGLDDYVEMPSIYSKALEDAALHKKNPMGCVRKGYIQLPYDMRQIPGVVDVTGEGDTELNSMALSVVQAEDATAYANIANDSDRGFRFSEYLTEQDFQARNGQQFLFSGEDVLQMKPETQRSLTDRIVFVGAHWHADAVGTGPLVDVHNSPGGAEPGVMLHANYVEAMLDRTGTFATVSDNTAEILELVLILALAAVEVLEIHSGLKWGAFVCGCLLSVLLTYVLLQNLGIFLDFLIPLMMIVGHTVVEKLFELRHGEHP